MHGLFFEEKRRYTLQALSRYWSRRESLILDLPMPTAEGLLDGELSPPQMAAVPLPPWAEHIGVNSALLVPSRSICAGDSPPWLRTDWLGAAFWYLNAFAERAFENVHGPIHSYAFRLAKWDTRLWDRAWVNRIALFLRTWAARENNQNEDLLFGPLPKPDLLITHDVDATKKTLAICFKQSAFQFANAAHHLFCAHFSEARHAAIDAAQFPFRNGNLWCFDTITALEHKQGLRSHFFFYAGPGGWKRSPKLILLDPSYKISEPTISRQIKTLDTAGWPVGLHQSFDSWTAAAPMKQEKERLENILNHPVTSCRQHWLRFSWADTWRAQEKAGFELDYTLGFNDRPGLRNSAALRYRPWDPVADKPMTIESIPLVLMDSHLYNYLDLPPLQRQQQMQHWIDEIHAVHGIAAILWHQQVMSDAYGWGPGYETLLHEIQKQRSNNGMPKPI